RFYEDLLRRHYAHHTYGHPIIGWGKDIQGYTFEDAIGWYREHYAPNNAALVLVGDVTAKSVRPLVEKYYGKVPSVVVPMRKAPVEPRRDAPLAFVKVDPQVKVPVWNLMFRTPTHVAGVAGASPRPGEAVALWALAEIVGGSDTSRLYNALV